MRSSRSPRAEASSRDRSPSGSRRPSSRRRSSRHAAPVASQRCQTNVVAIGRSPSNEPVDAVSWRPTVSRPVDRGRRDRRRREVLLVDDRERVVRDGERRACQIAPGDPHAEREADVRRRRRVCRERRARDRHARGEVAGRIASPPGVGEGQRRRAVPGACGETEGAVDRVAADRSAASRASTGASAVTGAVDSEFWRALPCAFVAVICTRNRFPKSAATGV